MTGGATESRRGEQHARQHPAQDPIPPHGPQRKSLLFAGHHEGAHGRARIVALAETRKPNGIAPLACQNASLEAIAAGRPVPQIHDLTPRAFSPALS